MLPCFCVEVHNRGKPHEFKPEQLRAHEEKELEMRQALEDLMKEAPPLNAKGHVVQQFFYKERYLYQEVGHTLFHELCRVYFCALVFWLISVPRRLPTSLVMTY